MGKIIDFISGLEVNDTPEEVEATQPFSKILVDDYKYPKEYIQTRPQFRVKVRPSDNNKSYPVDIAVFSNSKKEIVIFIWLLNAKRKTRRRV